MANEDLPQVTVEDLLRMIGDREVTMARQATVIASQAARLAELEPVEARPPLHDPIAQYEKPDEDTQP